MTTESRHAPRERYERQYVTMVDLLRHPGSRTFLWLWFGQTVSTFGTGVTFFALGVYPYETTARMG